jgi:hypothetical protein
VRLKAGTFATAVFLDPWRGLWRLRGIVEAFGSKQHGKRQPSNDPAKRRSIELWSIGGFNSSLSRAPARRSSRQVSVKKYLLDTNVLLRVLLDDHPELSRMVVSTQAKSIC